MKCRSPHIRYTSMLGSLPIYFSRSRSTARTATSSICRRASSRCSTAAVRSIAFRRRRSPSPRRAKGPSPSSSSAGSIRPRTASGAATITSTPPKLSHRAWHEPDRRRSCALRCMYLQVKGEALSVRWPPDGDWGPCATTSSGNSSSAGVPHEQLSEPFCVLASTTPRLRLGLRPSPASSAVSAFIINLKQIRRTPAVRGDEDDWRSWLPDLDDARFMLKWKPKRTGAVTGDSHPCRQRPPSGRSGAAAAGEADERTRSTRTAGRRGAGARDEGEGRASPSRSPGSVVNTRTRRFAARCRWRN